MRKDNNKRYANDLALKAYSGMCMAVIASCLAAHAEEIPFIEEGKIWWYEVGEGAFWDGTREWVSLVGITTKGERKIDGEIWTECHMIDSDRNIVTTFPLALLREADRRIYVTDENLNYSNEEWREKVYNGCTTDKYEILNTILMYAGFMHNMPNEYDDDYYDPVFKDFPVLLYDFNWKEGDNFSWPWASVEEERFISPTEFSIVSTGGDRTLAGSPEYYDFIIDDPIYTVNVTYGGRIIEGIGEIYMKREDEYDDPENAGFFFNPGQLLPPRESGINTPTRIPPFLVKVERPDGTVIYENKRNDINELHANHNSRGDTCIYNIFGQKITILVPGSIYIRDGKKFVAE